MVSVTRSQTGRTPKKPEHPGFVETPTVVRRSRSRARSQSRPRRSASRGVAEAETKIKREEEVQDVAPAAKKQKNYKIDDSGEYEFCGPWGVSMVMLGFPLMMYYFWVGQVYYDGQFPWPKADESWEDFGKHLVQMALECAMPTVRSFAVYWVFMVWQVVLYITLPGVWTKGNPLPHLNGERLPYFCNAMWSLYVTLTTVGVLHATGIFNLTELIDDFGAYMSAGILSGIIVAVIAYVSAIARGAQHKMTGNHVYDFFMGAELNPRIFKIVDLKMFFEVRLPWYILLIISIAGAIKQYELYGYVTPQMSFFILAHWLYGNACSKGEELIVTTYDMFTEKWGFMLIFWNMAGVPLSYCQGPLYIVRHHPSRYNWSLPTNIAIYSILLAAYFVFDTCNSQKNRFRQMEKGTLIIRKTFPQLPYQTIKNPTFIRCKNGGTLLTSGWYGMARKIHYTADFFQLGSWGLICGFESPLPWFLPVFFTLMILHRTYRDDHRCAQKYGDDWKEYTRQVPYLYIPYVI